MPVKLFDNDNEYLESIHKMQNQERKNRFISKYSNIYKANSKKCMDVLAK